MDFYTGALIWISGALAGFSVSCLLIIFALKRGGIRLR